MAKTRRPLTDEEREARRAAQRELVRASIEQLRSSDGWQAYLHARRRFPSYSWRNILLILPPTTHRDARRGVPRMAGSRLLRPQAPRRRPRGRVGDPDLGALRAQPQADAGVARRRRRPRRAAPRDLQARQRLRPGSGPGAAAPGDAGAAERADRRDLAATATTSCCRASPRSAPSSATRSPSATPAPLTAAATPRPRRSSSPSAWTPTAASSPASTSSRMRSWPRTTTPPSSPTPRAS